MKKYLFIIAAAATCMLVACSKENELKSLETTEENAKEFVRLPGWTYIGATNSEEVKASVDGTDASFSWNTGDAIAVYSNGVYHVSAGLDASFNGTNSATFGFEGDIEAGRENFAVFPANLVNDDACVASPSAASLKIKLPASYTLAQVQGEVSPVPMIAVNEPNGGLAFKSVCALLRITVKNIAWDAKSIRVRFPGQKVNGLFTIANYVSGTSGIVGQSSESEAEQTITITDLGISEYVDQLVINIPVPMGTFDNVVVGAYDNSNLKINYISTPVKVVSDVPTTWTPGRKARRTVTANLPVFTISGASIEAADRKMIVFAPGNLQARLDVVPQPGSLGQKDGNTIMNCALKCFGTADEWRFAAHQYESFNNYIPEGRTHSLNSLVESVKGDYTDLFAWIGADMTNEQFIAKSEEYKYGIFYSANSGTSTYVGNTTGGTLKHDWGELAINYDGGTYAANTYRLPTGAEWEFVFTNRKLATTPRIKQGTKATIIRSVGDTVAFGMIILPDNYAHPYGVTELTKVYYQDFKIYDQNSGGATCLDNVYTLTDWQKLEDAGCVFLPMTNQSAFNADAQCALTRSPGVGLYWSSTNNKTSLSYALAFNGHAAGAVNAYDGGGRDNVQFKYSRSRYYCLGVRLIREIKK